MSANLPEFRQGLPAAKVDQSLRQAFAALDAAHQCALLWFHDAWKRKLHCELGYASMEQYATESLGFSPNRAWQFLRLSRDLDRLPPLLEAVTSGDLEWTKAQQVGRVATPQRRLTGWLRRNKTADGSWRGKSRRASGEAAILHGAE